MLIPRIAKRGGFGLAAGSDFTCTKGVCTPTNQTIGKTFQVMQQQLNRALTALSKESLLVGIDGVVGPQTVAGVAAATDAAQQAMKKGAFDLAPDLSDGTPVAYVRANLTAQSVAENAEALTRYFAKLGNTTGVVAQALPSAALVLMNTASIVPADSGAASPGHHDVPRYVWYIAGGAAALGLLGLFVHLARKKQHHHELPHMAGFRVPPRLHGYGYGRY